MTSLIKWDSFLLFLIKNCFLVCMCSSTIKMSTEIGIWSEVSLQLGWIWWLSNTWELGCKKMRSKTEFESQALSVNLVGENSIGLDNLIWKEPAISKRVSL